MSLSTDQIEAYWKEGYVVVEGLIPQIDLERFSSRFEAIIEGRVKLSPMMKIMKDSI